MHLFYVFVLVVEAGRSRVTATLVTFKVICRALAIPGIEPIKVGALNYYEI
jgi:hypothetical protein